MAFLMEMIPCSYDTSRRTAEGSAINADWEKAPLLASKKDGRSQICLKTKGTESSEDFKHKYLFFGKRRGRPGDEKEELNPTTQNSVPGQFP
ncbi:hypothetical protein QR680_004769 [Steinernema hermaphroditum]|uniref:Uncharacterized protein n=1 Tax=Steinernema hermaphroditum TaxID=289476 RepID=A0AA39LUI4_9BILA|nr:hypothetical protein QR680_004769 [Steinernema hermaphroditum]